MINCMHGNNNISEYGLSYPSVNVHMLCGGFIFRPRSCERLGINSTENIQVGGTEFSRLYSIHTYRSLVKLKLGVQPELLVE